MNQTCLRLSRGKLAKHQSMILVLTSNLKRICSTMTLKRPPSQSKSLQRLFLLCLTLKKKASFLAQLKLMNFWIGTGSAKSCSNCLSGKYSLTDLRSSLQDSKNLESTKTVLLKRLMMKKVDLFLLITTSIMSDYQSA